MKNTVLILILLISMGFGSKAKAFISDIADKTKTQCLPEDQSQPIKIRKGDTKLKYNSCYYESKDDSSQTWFDTNSIDFNIDPQLELRRAKETLVYNSQKLSVSAKDLTLELANLAKPTSKFFAGTGLIDVTTQIKLGTKRAMMSPFIRRTQERVIEKAITDPYVLENQENTIKRAIVDDRVQERTEASIKKATLEALAETFTGYAEHQRRKAAEEIINSNYKTKLLSSMFLHASTDGLASPEGATKSFAYNEKGFGGFLKNLIYGFNLVMGQEEGGGLGFNNQLNLLIVSKKLLASSFAKKVMDLIKNLMLIFVEIITVLAIVKRILEANGDINLLAMQPILKALGVILLINYLDHLIEFILSIAIRIQAFITNEINNNFRAFDTDGLIEVWENIANNIGYQPAAALAWLDMGVQFFTYFFILGLVLYLCLGKILSPLWAVSLFSDEIRSYGYQSIINWIRTLFVIALIPLVFKIISKVSSLLALDGMFILQACMSIAGYLYLPFLSNLILAKESNGILSPALSGYEGLHDSLHSGFMNLRSSMETIHDEIIDANSYTKAIHSERVKA